MRSKLLVTIALLLAGPLSARAVKIVEPIAPGVVGANHVVGITVTIGAAAAKVVAALEDKASAKRAAAGLAPAAVDPAAAVDGDPYATLPLAQMLPLEIRDATKAWGLTEGRAIKLEVEVDTLKTADAGMAMLLGSADQLAGLVMVKDAETGAPLGEFFVDVIKVRSGLAGLALRGTGVREKLAAEFAKHVGEALTGLKRPPAKAA